MPQFRYTARRSDGQLAQGTVEANDRAGAVLLVERQKCFPIKIEPVGIAAPGTGKAAGAAPATQARAVSKNGAPAPAEIVETIPLSGQFLFTEQLGHPGQEAPAAEAPGAMPDAPPGAGGWPEPLPGDAAIS